MSDRVEQLKKLWPAVEESLAQIAASPDDPKAN